MVHFISSTRINAEGNTKICKGLFHDAVVLVDHLLRGYPLSPGFDGDRHTMLIAATNKNNIALIGTQKPYVNV